MDPRLVQHDDAVPASTANTESSATTNPSYKLPTTDDTNGMLMESENANHTRIMLAEEQDVMDEDDDDASPAKARGLRCPHRHKVVASTNDPRSRPTRDDVLGRG